MNLWLLVFPVFYTDALAMVCVHVQVNTAMNTRYHRANANLNSISMWAFVNVYSEHLSLFIPRSISNLFLEALLSLSPFNTSPPPRRHDGLIIMATNRPYDLDEAMHRRIMIAIEFRQPDHLLRKAIWESHIPEAMKMSDDTNLVWCTVVGF